MKKRIFAAFTGVAVAAAMMFGGAVSAFADEAKTIDVEVSGQYSGYFKYLHKTVKVSPDTAEKYYGEKNPESQELAGSGKVSDLDVLIAAHQDAGKDFEVQESTYGGYIVKLWGVESGNIGVFKNGELTPAAIGQNEISGGDTVEFNVYSGSYSDGTLESQTFFRKDGKITDSITVKENEEVDLELVKKTAVYGSDWSVSYKEEAVKGAYIGLVKESNAEADGVMPDPADKDLTADPSDSIITGENGSFKLKMSSKGTYILSAVYMTESEEFIFMPWCEVKVTAEKEPATDPSEDPSKETSEKPSKGSSGTEATTTAVSDADKTKASSAKTGDDSHLMIFILIAAAAAVCGGAVVLSRKKAQ